MAVAGLIAASTSLSELLLLVASSYHVRDLVEDGRDSRATPNGPMRTGADLDSDAVDEG